MGYIIAPEPNVQPCHSRKLDTSTEQRYNNLCNVTSRQHIFVNQHNVPQLCSVQ
ncbi:hypothetical protein DPMN_005431 [Dreissena polymorpha]|uniref:Uncharacterized protein n=1 Tax=Dreissena polymorpha TaxID=45954 RepID=A0A9D4RWH4_DREPO|nr:hypothetical protein DPMN_005431 [Dreissena polymorpha]